MARRNPEKALYRVTPVNGPQAEVEADDKRDLVSMIRRSAIIPARYVGPQGSFDWLLNAGFIVFALKEEARSPASPSDESATTE